MQPIIGNMALLILLNVFSLANSFFARTLPGTSGLRRSTTADMVTLSRPKVSVPHDWSTKSNSQRNSKWPKHIATYKPQKRRFRSQGEFVTPSSHPKRKAATSQVLQLALDQASMARKNRNMASTAVDTFLLVLASGVHVSLRDCNMLLRELGDGGFMDACAAVLEVMSEANIAPSMVTYSTLIARAGTWGHVELAETYYERMRLAGLLPDVVCYNSLINAYAKAGLTDRALQVLVDMDRNGCKATAVTLNSIMDSCARSGQLAKAQSIFDMFKQRNIQPTVQSYSNIIFAACRAGNMDQAFETLDYMIAQGLSPSEVTYSVLLDGLGKAGRLEEAFTLLKEIRQNGIKPNVVIMSTLVDACGRNGQLDLAFSIYEHMMSSAHPANRPNSVTCSSLIDASLKQGDIDRFFKVLRDMQARGLPLTEVTYTSIITELARLDKLDAVVKVMEICKGSGDFGGVFRFYQNLMAQGLAAETPAAFKTVIDTIATNAPVGTPHLKAPSSSPSPPKARIARAGAKSLLRSDERLLQLFLVFREMQAAGVQADAGTYNTIINACAAQGDADRALEVVQMMQDNAVAPDIITYTSLLKACAFRRKGNDTVALAEDIFSEMIQRTNHFSTYIAPTERTYHRLMQVYLRATPMETEKIWALLESMKSQGIEPGKLTWRTIARAAVKDKDVPRALYVVNQIRELGGDRGGAGFDFKVWFDVARLLSHADGKEVEATRLKDEIARSGSRS